MSLLNSAETLVNAARLPREQLGSQGNSSAPKGTAYFSFCDTPPFRAGLVKFGDKVGETGASCIQGQVVCLGFVNET